MAVAALIEAAVPMFVRASWALLNDADSTRSSSFGGLLSMPFQQEAPHSLTQKSGLDRAYIDNIPV
jgi:hypothetical protein